MLMDGANNITNSEYEALFDLYSSTAGWNWVWSDGPGIPWNFTHYDNPCLDFWQGVTCSEFPADGFLHIVELNLYSHDLEGYLPESIGNLIYLRNLTLDQNELFYGTIPESIGQLTRLQVLQLHETFVNGTIPESIGNLTELIILDLGNNNLFGTIPRSLCGLNRLVDLDISANSLTGTIPACFGDYSNVLYLIMFLNELHGSIPSELGKLTQLLQLALYYNRLSGSIPNELASLTNMLDFDFAENFITGTLPSWVGNFVCLTGLGVNTNLLTGTIPPELGNLVKLESLYLSFNDFTGTIPLTIGNLVDLLYLNVAANQLSGPCPTYVSNFAQLHYFTLFDNSITGTLPKDFDRAVSLQEINIGANLMEGMLPNMWNCSQLLAYVVSNNQFTSTVPESLLYLPQLYIVEMGLNQLSGQLPEIELSSPIVTFSSVGYNHLTGTIPASFSNVENLVYLNLSFNYLTSSLPENITSLVKLNFLYLSSNMLTGQLPQHWGNMPDLSYVFMGQNFFSGNIPRSFGFVKLLISLNLSHNHLTGTIPDSLAQLRELQVLLLQDNYLEGNLHNALNSSYQLNLTTLKFSNNQLTGTLPTQLFHSDTLAVFAAVSNCFTGSIPLSICNSTSINTLALDGLQSATSCRRALFPSSLNSIVASGLYTIANPLTGGVPGCLFEIPALTTLHLSGNGLTGSISNMIRVSPTLTDLSLSHNKLTGSIPSVLLDHSWVNLDLSYNVFTHSLSPESSEVYARNASSFLEQNRLSGRIPKVFEEVTTISMLESNLFACDAQTNDLPPHDPNIDKYQCGSDTLNATLYAWASVAFTVLITTVIFSFWRYDLEEYLQLRLERVMLWWRGLGEVPELANYTQVNHTTEVIVRLSGLCTLWCIFVIMPIYIAMSFVYGTYTHQYAWTLSAAYLSGAVPFAIEFAFLALLSVIAYCFFRMNIGVVTKQEGNDLNNYGTTQVSSAGFRLVVYTCYILSTFSVALGVNIAYVVIALNENGNALTAAQFALAVFKVGFNSVCSPLLIRAISYYVLEDRRCQDFVSIQLVVGLVNNIAIPCFVVAIISPSCFYNIFEAADSVESSYVYYGRCLKYNTYNTIVITCLEAQVLSATTSYDPPFAYSYQCSSSFITYYAPAYVIMSLLAGLIVPVLQIALKALHTRTTPHTYLNAFVDLLLPRILKPPNSNDAENSQESLLNLHFDAQQHLTTILNYLGLLLTFGAVFPPLAICFLVTMVSIASFARLKVGRFLHLVATEQNKCVQIVNNACVGAGDLKKLTRAVLTVLVFSCIFYTLFLFDTLGDAEGFSRAYWVLIVVPFIPLSLYFANTYAPLLKPVQPAKSDDAMGNVELKTFSNCETENPIVTMATP